jgi:hypothetical protein
MSNIYVLIILMGFCSLLKCKGSERMSNVNKIPLKLVKHKYWTFFHYLYTSKVNKIPLKLVKHKYWTFFHYLYTSKVNKIPLKLLKHKYWTFFTTFTLQR